MSADLTERVRAALAPHKPAEQPMFGGTAFMIAGKMVASASKRGLLLRVGREGQAAALQDPQAKPMKMGARTMSGYVRIAATVSDADLRRWLDVGLACVRSLGVRSLGAKKPAARKAATAKPARRTV